MPIRRIKSTWHESDRNQSADRSLDEDVASALAFIIWRIALESAKDLHRERFDYGSDQQRAAVIAEFVAFLVQSTDRLTFEQLEDDERRALINGLGRKLADHFQDNLTDLFGAGDYQAPFIATLNERMADYSEFSFSKGEPGYDFLRYFGDRVLKIMGDSQTNRWVIDQIMEQAGPEAIKHLRNNLPNLLGE